MWYFYTVTCRLRSSRRDGLSRSKTHQGYAVVGRNKRSALRAPARKQRDADTVTPAKIPAPPYGLRIAPTTSRQWAPSANVETERRNALRLLRPTARGQLEVRRASNGCPLNERRGPRQEGPSRPGEFHPEPLTEP